MSISVAIVIGLALGAAISVAAFEVCDRFEVNLFHIEDAA